MFPKAIPTEQIRWYLMRAIEASRPIPASELILSSVLAGTPISLTGRELRRELDFLARLGLVTVDRSNPNQVLAEPTAQGMLFAQGKGPDVDGIDRIREGL